MARILNHGIELLDRGKLTFRCVKCLAVLSPASEDGRLPKDYWKCPKGCN